MDTIFCFTTNLLLRPQRRSVHFSELCNSVGFLTSKSPNLPSSHSASSNFDIRLQSKSFFSSSLPGLTHLQVSELESSSPSAIKERDLLIVGPGVLGRLVAEKWREEHPGSQVYGQTATTDHHGELSQMGINPSLNWTESTHNFPNVLYCAPPSRTSDYPNNVRLAALSWNGEGSFLFISSSAPYDCNDNGPCNEDTPAVPIGRNPRADVLLKAENVVLEVDRGAHNYWLERGIVDRRPDHVLNLIHYEDAASLVVAILKKKFRGQIFLGCDNHPLSRQELMDLINKSGKFHKKFDKFTGTDDPLGKRLNNTRTRQLVGWVHHISGTFRRRVELAERERCAGGMHTWKCIAIELSLSSFFVSV
ncbi:hypothetical protein L6164_017008 [Bauhinia variegata]|uniref:Uncharacterized protein n=1 Tax=Bauhinia variegata TaxID=167791 RepID=A0ACB9N6G5_BAUVA|nr:hypothetical protein L6164_017008 [Bauhinia variegata]